MTIDLTKLDDLNRRAEGEEGPGNETWRLLLESAKLLLSEAGSEIWTWTDPQVKAYDQAALHLIREACPDWVIVTLTNGMIDPKYLDVREYVSWRVCLAPKKHLENPMECTGWPDVYDASLARALLLATLKARKAMVEG